MCAEKVKQFHLNICSRTKRTAHLITRRTTSINGDQIEVEDFLTESALVFKKHENLKIDKCNLQ